LIYDVVLASRGWGVEEFRLATPEFLSASRWAVMAERAVAVFQEAQTTAAMEIPRGDAAYATRVARAKVASVAMVKDWQPWLFPEDDDGST
jgi:hypothetical protein